jgi:hypothetical protein
MPFVILPTNSASGGYDLTNSLRFNNGSSDSLTRTAGTFTSRDTFTVSAWVKFSGIGGTNQNPIISFDGSNQYMAIRFGSTSFDFDNISYQGSTIGRIISSAVYRDFSAWYHVLVAIDSTQATASNRMRSYINGVEVTAFSSTTYPTQNTDMISTSMTTIRVGAGVDQTGTTSYFGGYMSDVFYIDGQQLTPSSFGETDFDTGIWKPKAYTSSYGTNGFYLQFKNSASLGTDSSGNGNTFTVNNLTSVDQSTDTPTNNFATFNSLESALNGNSTVQTFSEGNLQTVTPNTVYGKFGGASTIGASKSKWYAEIKVSSAGGTYPTYSNVGITGDPAYNANTTSAYIGGQSYSAGYYNQGGLVQVNNATVLNTGVTKTAPYTVMVAMDLDNNFVYFGISNLLSFLKSFTCNSVSIIFIKYS